MEGLVIVSPRKKFILHICKKVLIHFRSRITFESLSMRNSCSGSDTTGNSAVGGLFGVWVMRFQAFYRRPVVHLLRLPGERVDGVNLGSGSVCQVAAPFWLAATQQEEEGENDGCWWGGAVGGG
jgi:hypothetical protein